MTTGYIREATRAYRRYAKKLGCRPVTISSALSEVKRVSRGMLREAGSPNARDVLSDNPYVFLRSTRGVAAVFEIVGDEYPGIVFIQDLAGEEEIPDWCVAKRAGTVPPPIGSCPESPRSDIRAWVGSRYYTQQHGARRVFADPDGNLSTSGSILYADDPRTMIIEVEPHESVGAP